MPRRFGNPSSQVDTTISEMTERIPFIKHTSVGLQKSHLQPWGLKKKKKKSEADLISNRTNDETAIFEYS